MLTLKNSMGDLTIEGWDRPDVEITAIKSTKAAYAAQDRERVSRELDKVHVSVERKSEGLVITTDFRGTAAFRSTRCGGMATLIWSTTSRRQ